MSSDKKREKKTFFLEPSYILIYLLSKEFLDYFQL